MLASATVLPFCNAASVGAKPGRADERVQDDVGLGVRGESLGGVGPDQELDTAGAN